MTEPVFTVYKTTNLINGKIYIGVHKTRDLNDKYLGSGKLISFAIEKHGRENFKREILFVFDNLKEAYAKEAELVTTEFWHREDTYNAMPGGVLSAGWYRDRKGTKNPSFGTIWIHHPLLGEKKISREVQPEEGWKLGRIPRPKKVRVSVPKPRRPKGSMRYVHRGEEEKVVLLSLVDELLKEGWRIGRAPKYGEIYSKAKHTQYSLREHPSKGRVRIHHVSHPGTKLVFPANLPEYLALGWQLGWGPSMRG